MKPSLPPSQSDLILRSAASLRRVSKDGHVLGGACCHPSRRALRALLRVCESFGVYIKGWARRSKYDSLRLTIREREMTTGREDQLFEDLPEQRGPRTEGRGAPRLRVPERDQIGMHLAALDDLIPADHLVRAIWAFTLGLDLSPLYDAIKACEGVPGHPPASPQLMMALWLFATINGVGSARQLDRLCREHLAYRWLCGGVSMNSHTLADFRTAHMELLDRLLAGGVATLVEAGLVALDVLAQDGLRVRAAAGAASFRRRGRLLSLRLPRRAP